MSEIFERILKEKQDEIDSLRAREASSMSAWAAHHRRYEKLVECVFVALHSKDVKDLYQVRLLLAQQGWCISCERNPCECEDQYD
jgi:hypothetical protein